MTKKPRKKEKTVIGWMEYKHGKPSAWIGVSKPTDISLPIGSDAWWEPDLRKVRITPIK